MTLSPRFKARIRAFHIWQILGINPWKRPKAGKKKKEGDLKGFVKGSFDSIPFMNDDAKRTFVHLLLRPGYMIRDYINGKHEIYLAPLTSLIIFYAFFTLVSSVAKPEMRTWESGTGESIESVTKGAEPAGTGVAVGLEDEEDEEDGDDTVAKEENPRVKAAINTLTFLKDTYKLLDLDRHPERIDTPRKASLAALESALRSQGIPLFLGGFLILWMALAIKLRKYGINISAAAAASAYIQCQFCFFMLFTLLLTWGKSTSLGLGLICLLMVFDYHQLLGTGWKKSFWLTVGTGITIAIISVFLFLIAAAILFLYIYFKK